MFPMLLVLVTLRAVMPDKCLGPKIDGILKGVGCAGQCAVDEEDAEKRELGEQKYYELACHFWLHRGLWRGVGALCEDHAWLD